MVLQLSPAAKARVVVTVLAALLIWPPIHYWLVESRALDPWKFFGFAMYCRPSIPVSIDAWVLVDGRRTEYPTDTWPTAGRARLRSFLRDRKILGTWRQPNGVAQWLFRARPDVEQVLLVVQHPRIDRATGLITVRDFPYGYVRPRSN